MTENLEIYKLDDTVLEKSVDLFIETFSKEPWYDEFASREQVVLFFKNHMLNNYFLGYVLKSETKVIALSVGFKKPWIKGMEYYIDQFCVGYSYQGQGVGGAFIKLIEKEMLDEGLNAIILNTEKGYPSEKFYLKNGFEKIDELIILAK